MASELAISSSLIPQFFELEDKEKLFLQSIAENRAELEAFISQRIHYLLEYDMEGLINKLYRIDVAERAFHQAMLFPDRADRLAFLVIERLIQKAKFRIWYKENS